MKEKKIKILFIIDNLWNTGGAQNQLFLLLREINKDLFDVYVCSLNSKEDFFVSKIEELGIKVFVIPQRGFFDLKCLIRLYFLIKKLKPDIVNTFLYTAEFYGRLSAILAGIRIIIDSVRNIDLWKKRRNVWADRFLNRFTTHFIANSYAVKDYLIKRYKIKETQVSVVYNGVDLEKFNMPTRENLELAIPSNKKIILNIARFEPQKDHFTLIECSKLILEKRKDVIFLLVGKGEEKRKVERRIEEIGIKEYFIILDEIDNPNFLYKISYLGVLPSLYEGCSNFILECMFTGKPVVATNVGGNPELIIEGRTGYLVEKKNPLALADKIMYLLEHPEVAEEMGRLGRELAKKNFSLKNMVSSSEELFKKLLR